MNKALNDIYKLIEESKIISFDIFDTLLLRPYMKPTDLFLHLEKITNKQGFYKVRNNAEQQFYRLNGRKKEADLEDIYNQIPDFKELKNKELQLELSTLYLNKEIKTIYDYALNSNKKIIIASDMYLSIEFIKKILNKNGIDGYDKIYISNDINKRKDTGTMYEYIIKDLNCNATDILHIGDNKYSDYIQAQKYGIKAFLYVPKFKISADKKIIKSYKNNKKNFTSSIMTKFISENSYKYKDYWTAFGYKYAGAFIFQYVSWIYDKCIKENINNVLFIARDGYLLKKIFDIINKSNITSNYIYAPRIVNYVTNLEYDKNLEEQIDIICKYFNIDRNKFESNTGKNIDKLKDMAKIAKEKIGYGKYINQFIKNNLTNIAVVDTISNNLSAQKLIEKEINIKTTGLYVLSVKNKYVNQYYHNFVEKKLKNKFLRNNTSPLIELICSSPENPIVMFDNGHQIYQDNITKEEEYRHEVYIKIEKGILDFVKDILSVFQYEDIYFDNYTCMKHFLFYIDNLSKTDKKEISKIYKSIYADNSTYIPLMVRFVRFRGSVIPSTNKLYIFYFVISKFIFLLKKLSLIH